MVGVVAVALLPILGITVVAAVISSDVAEQATRSRAMDVVRGLAESVEREFDRYEAILVTLAASSGIEAKSDGAEFEIRRRMASEFAGAHITRRLLSQPGPAEAGNATEAALAAASARAVALRDSVLTDVMAAPDSLMPVTALVVPILRDGVAVGTLDMMVPSDRLIAALRRNAVRPGGLMVLVDRQMRIVASNRDVVHLTGQIYTPSEGESEFRWVRLGSKAKPRALVAEFGRAPGWRVIFSADRTPSGLLGEHVRSASVLASLAAAGAGLWLAFVLGTRLVRRLRVLSDLVRNVATGNDRPEGAMVVSDITEIEELRQGMVRADAVLRRRGAAERMALREARTGHELLVSVVNGTAEWIHVKDLELRYVLVNRAGLRAGEMAFEEWQVLGRTAADLFPPAVARRIEAADRHVLATGRMISFEQDYNIGGAGGETFWVSMTIAPWQDAEGQVVGVVSVSRDITRQRLADARLRALQADLLRATRLSAMGAMASGLAHELNQPLAAATNYLNAGGRLLDRAAHGDTEVFPLARHAVADAAVQMLRAGSIVRRLRDFVERGEVELLPEDVGDLLREACDLARSDGVAGGMVLRIDIEADAGAVLVDRTQIQQVLLNLIRNAAEAIGSAEPAMVGEIVVGAGLSADGGMQIDVADNGPGLAFGIAERLFEPFVSSKATGMGIGLAICRTIIEGHGGSLIALANLPHGMRFRIALPALSSPGQPYHHLE
jgi:two-component system sensor kinase FixL